MTRLFIYGTLKRGQVNHHLLQSGTFIGEAHTQSCYRLLNLGWYPGLANADKNGLSISGELWEVSTQHLETLDAYEGEEYRREPVRLLEPEFDPHTEAYVLANPDWTRPDAGTTWNG